LLKWQNADYNEVGSYVVERSANGKDFAAIAQTKPESVNNQWLDVNPAGPVLYYRIKAVSRNNSVVYSKIVSITKESIGQLSVLPNPIKNGIVKLFVQGVKDGYYELTVSNSSGATVIKQTVFVNENTERDIKLPGSAGGILYVQLKGNNTILNSSILVR